MLKVITEDIFRKYNRNEIFNNPNNAKTTVK
jgi:hypothetical protein